MENKEVINDILKKDGLSLEKLDELSYCSQLGISLKKNLHYFDKAALFDEITRICIWYDKNDLLHNISIDYRIKSRQSARLKFERFYPDRQARKVFDDLLGFRSLCDNYEEVLKLSEYDNIRVADMTGGKAEDDGYRGVHVYYQKSSRHYPIEIQYNTYYDRQLNNWLHKFLYKKDYPARVGADMRKAYEAGKVRTEFEFMEVLKNVLSDSEKC